MVEQRTLENRTLEDILRMHIAEHGLIPYSEFVNIALYNTLHGYYRKGKPEHRDFATSPEIHNVFGKTIGRYIQRLSDSLALPCFTILELGGGSGRLAKDIISTLSNPAAVRYLILERGEDRSTGRGRIEWINSLDGLDLSKVFTFIVSNEFFDALPFHKLIKLNGRIHEVFVGYNAGFFEQPLPPSPQVESFLNEFPVFLGEKQVSEATPRMKEIIEQVSGIVKQACFLAFDYGYHQVETVSGRFPAGSVVGYRNWSMCEDIFADIGKTDITHHVNFDHLRIAFQKQGWKDEGEIEQYRFLFNIGIVEALNDLSRSERMSAKWLIHPEGLGSMISVLGFSKGLPFPMGGFRGN